MIEGAVLIYGLTASFVMSSAQRNRKLDKPHSRKLVYAAHVMIGASFGSAGLIGIMAARHMGA